MSSVECIVPKRIGDKRGWFSETYSEAALALHGIDCLFVQDNHSCSAAAYTLRGLHYQAVPYAQAKLVRCVRGRAFDVAVDIQRGSPNYGQWVGFEITAEHGEQVFIPAGFAHGFLTLEPDCEILYKCSQPYAPASEGGIIWDDPAIAIDWPLPSGRSPVLSDRDKVHPTLTDLESPFVWEAPKARQRFTSEVA